MSSTGNTRSGFVQPLPSTVFQAGRFLKITWDYRKKICWHWSKSWVSRRNSQKRSRSLGCGVPSLQQLGVPQSCTGPVTLISAQQLFRLQGGSRKSESWRKVARGQFSSSAIFNCHFYRKPSKRVRLLKPNGATGIYWWTESQTQFLFSPWAICIYYYQKSHTDLSGAVLSKRMYLGLKCNFLLVWSLSLSQFPSPVLCQLVGS